MKEKLSSTQLFVIEKLLEHKDVRIKDSWFPTISKRPFDPDYKESISCNHVTVKALERKTILIPDIVYPGWLMLNQKIDFSEMKEMFKQYSEPVPPTPIIAN